MCRPCEARDHYVQIKMFIWLGGSVARGCNSPRQTDQPNMHAAFYMSSRFMTDGGQL